MIPRYSRPEMVRIYAADAELDPQFVNRFRGTVREHVYVGDVTTYMVTLDSGHKLEALLPNASAVRARAFDLGDPVQLAWQRDAGHFVLD